jgi:hypothetical protein
LPVSGCGTNASVRVASNLFWARVHVIFVRDGHGEFYLERHMSVGTIILIILVIVLLGGFSGLGGGPFYGTGYYGGGGLGLVIVILLILVLLGRI